MKNVVSAAWLHAALNDENMVVLDCSVDVEVAENGESIYQSGLDLYLQTRIPGAQHADLTGTLSDANSPYLFAIPDPDVLRSAMAALGVSDDKTVVLYDRSFTAWATRVWWMLRWIGFDNAMVLDGGLDAWQADYDIATGDPPPVVPGALSLHLRPDVIVDKEDVRCAIEQKDVSLIDTLSSASFAGQTEDYARPGHISGACNIFTLSHFEDGHFKSEAELREVFPKDQDGRYITYCGAGILASASAFILVQLGYQDVAVYAASLQEWAIESENPMSQHL